VAAYPRSISAMDLLPSQRWQQMRGVTVAAAAGQCCVKLVWPATDHAPAVVQNARYTAR